RPGDDTLDSKKVRHLAELVSSDLTALPPMKKAERTQLLKDCPMFVNILPQALDKDLTTLAAHLSRAEKLQIKFLYRAQLRVKEKMRLILTNLYEYLDPSR